MLDDRKQMVRLLRARGIGDERVLDAMERVPREAFLDASWASEAYADSALPIDHGQTISQPFVVALMAQAAALGPEDHVLEVGTGSGYGAAVLASLSRRVVTVERFPGLAALAQQRLEAAGFGPDRVQVRVGDGSLGAPEDAPFDAVVCTAGAPRLPRAFLEQLTPGGRWVVPLGDRRSQTLERGRWDGESRRGTGLASVRFVPLRGQDAWPAEAAES